MTPPRLTSLRVERFRQLKELTIPEIGHVNLIVGENNSGKSTLLDALRFFAGKADPQVLHAMLSEHGEYEPDSSNDEDLCDSVKNLFFDRKFPDKDEEVIYVGDKDKHDYISLEHILIAYNPDHTLMEGQPSPKYVKKNEDLSSYLESGSIFEAFKISLAMPLKVGGFFPARFGFFATDYNNNFKIKYKEFLAGQHCSYVPSRFRSPHELVDVWDRVALTDYEELALKALRTIDPDILNLAFIKNAQQHRGPGIRRHESEERIAFLKIKNKEKPIPLLSMGDGMSRVLQLILSASQAKDGFLLVDEIENGLHYSVQEKVWGMLFELAEKNNIQIFATTHSEDCVKTFAKVSTERQNVKGCLICLGRSPEGETEAAVLNEGQVQTLVQADIELR
jgi:AAA15 family ATPase/GTPase